MPDQPPALGAVEYAALRATVRERGTLRLVVIALTFVSWGGLVLFATAIGTSPGLAVVPLVALAAGFEVVFAAHKGVERIGRYLQVRYETPPPGSPGWPAWETMAMDLGRQAPGLGSAPLAWPLFLIAAAINAVTPWLQATEGLGQWSGAVLGLEALAHVAFAARVLGARAFAASQRERDLVAISAWLPSRSDR